MVKLIAATAVLIALTGCEQQYRYFCHDPANWESDRCKKPICDVNKDCPEHIFKGTNGNGASPVPQSTNSFRPTNQQGACK